MRVSEILLEDQNPIRAAVEVLDQLRQRLQNGQVLDEEAVALVRFMRVYADEHHRTEEEVLLPALEAAGVLRHASPIAQMLLEHHEGRWLLRAMEKSMAEGLDDPRTRGEFVEAARAFVRLTKRHLAREREVLVRMGEPLLEAVDELVSASLEKRMLEGAEQRERCLETLAGLTRAPDEHLH